MARSSSRKRSTRRRSASTTTRRNSPTRRFSSLLDSAIELLQRTDGAVDQAYLARTDKIYNGDRAKWTKFAHGLLAMHLNHYSNKASYEPAEVIAAVDRSFASNADDALLTYPNTNNDDINFWGRTRANTHNCTGRRSSSSA